MKRAYIIPNFDKAKTKEVLESIEDFFNKHNFSYGFDYKSSDDFILFLGGDGTFLSSAKLAFKYDIPLCGINTGRLGSLANARSDDYLGFLDYLINEEIKYEEYPILSIDDKIIINDLVLASNTSFNKFSIYKDKVLIKEYRASGLIISTGIGSTGINKSAGGPILLKEESNIALTPICETSGRNNSLVFSLNSEIEIISDKDFSYHLDGLKEEEIKTKVIIKREKSKLKRII